MSHEPMRLVTLEEKPGDWVAYLHPSQVVAIGLGDSREKALEDLVVILGLKLDITISLWKGVHDDDGDDDVLGEDQ